MVAAVDADVEAVDPVVVVIAAVVEAEVVGDELWAVTNKSI